MKMGKIWKNGGKEDQLIEKLFNEGKITRNITGSVLKRRFAKTFKGFSEDVVEKRVKILKKILTLNYARDHPLTSSRTHPRVHDKLKSHKHIPTLCETYEDPDTERDMVLVAVAVTGGAEDVKFLVSESGKSVTVTYSWPQTMYTMKDLFKREMAAENLPLCHPKVLAMKKGLQKYKQRIDDIPQSTVEIDLPIKVRDEVKISGIARDNGTKIVMAELVGFVNEEAT